MLQRMGVIPDQTEPHPDLSETGTFVKVEDLREASAITGEGRQEEQEEEEEEEEEEFIDEGDQVVVPWGPHPLLKEDEEEEEGIYSEDEVIPASGK